MDCFLLLSEVLYFDVLQLIFAFVGCAIDVTSILPRTCHEAFPLYVLLGALQFQISHVSPESMLS